MDTQNNQTKKLTFSQKIVRVAGFLIILAVCFMCFISVFKVKNHDGDYVLKTFYREKPQTVDVFFIGSSRVYCHINPAVLYTDHGIASFNLASARQPPWSSYHYLVEGLKTQMPKLVVFDATCLDLTKPVFLNLKNHTLKNTTGYKPSLNRLEALLAVAPEDEIPEYLFDFYHYHNRYTDLGPQDFKPWMGERIYKYYKGFTILYRTQKIKNPHNWDDDTCLALPVECEDYYRRIIELCKARNIPLLIILSPYPSTSSYKISLFNEAGKIAAEYNVPFINFNHLYDEIGLDFNTDIADEWHVNYLGSLKYSRYLGNYLNTNYNLPDHRKDAGYRSWKRNSDVFWQGMENIALKETNAWDKYLIKLKNNPQYVTVVSVAGKEEPQSKAILTDLGIDHFEEGFWVLRDGSVKLISSAITARPYLRFGSLCMDLRNAEDAYIDGTSYKVVNNGVNIIVYDRQTETIVDKIGLDASKNFTLTRKK